MLYLQLDRSRSRFLFPCFQNVVVAVAPIAFLVFGVFCCLGIYPAQAQSLVDKLLQTRTVDFSGCDAEAYDLSPGSLYSGGAKGISIFLSDDRSEVTLDFGLNTLSAIDVEAFLKNPLRYYRDPTSADAQKDQEKPKIDRVNLENVYIQGFLDIGHATIPHAIRLSNTVLCSDGGVGPRAALAFGGGTMEKSLTIRESIVLGTIIFGSNVFERDVSFNRLFVFPDPDRVPFPTLDMSSVADEKFDDEGYVASATDRELDIPASWDTVPEGCSAIDIDNSVVDGAFRIMNSYLGGGVCIRQNELELIESNTSHFAGYFDLYDNVIGNAWFESGVFDGDQVSVTYNDIGRSLEFVARRVSMDCIFLTRNSVAGGFFVELHEMSEVIDGACTYGEDIADRPEIDLSDNSVKGFTRLVFSDDVATMVRASNLISEHGLKLSLSRMDEDSRRERHSHGALDPIEGEDYQLPGYWEDEVLPSDETVRNEIHVDLAGARVGALMWLLPYHQKVSWQGIGFKYDHWSAGTKHIPEDQLLARMMLWRLALNRDYKKPVWKSQDDRTEAAALRGISDHLRSRGQNVLANTVAEEYKRVTYTRVPENASPFEISLRWVVSWFLWPSGYGAKPEQVLFFIFGGWLFGFLYYHVYVLMKQEKAASFRQLREAEDDSYNPLEDDEYLKEFGSVAQPGFAHFDKINEVGYKDFRLMRYSLDAMVPVVSLYGYDKFYPIDGHARFVSSVQHIAGWWWLTVFTASLTIL